MEHPVDPAEHPVDPADHPVDPAEFPMDPAEHRADPMEHPVGTEERRVDRAGHFKAGRKRLRWLLSHPASPQGVASQQGTPASSLVTFNLAGRPMMSKLPIQGPIELVNDQFCLMIPLEAGGDELVPLTTKIATVEGDMLKVVVPDWMMKYLGLRVDGLVDIDIVDGKFNIKSAEWKPGDPPPEMPTPGYVHPR